MTSVMTVPRREEDLYVDMDYRILYEDDWFLSIDKPSPLPVHAVGRFRRKNLLSLMKKDRPLLADSLSVVNRLDSETSGIVLIAKNSEVSGRLGLQFETRRVEKEYRAIVFGVPDPAAGSISIPLGFEERNRYHVRIPDPSGETAETRYETLERRGGYSLMRILPLTGRTHQIRAHLAFIGHPIAGDKVYIDLDIYDRYVRAGWQEEMREVVGLPRLALHASRLVIGHPASGLRMELHSEFPPALTKFWEGAGPFENL